jgi:parallel beta-helix repeat protein
VTRLLLALWMLFPSVAFATEGAWPAMSGGGLSITTNEAQDTDGDGDADTIYVADFDGDGTLEMEDDIGAAYAALTDVTGRSLFILPGSYAVDADAAGSDGWLEINGDTNVLVECFPGAVLNGNGIAAPDEDLAVLFIEDSDRVTLRGCEIDGGTDTTYTTSGLTNVFRMGVRVRNSTYVTIENNYIHDVQSVGIFFNGTSNSRARKNRVEYVGGYGDSFGTTNAGIEVFTDSGATSAIGNEIVENTVSFGGSTCWTQRKTTATDIIADTQVTGNKFTRCKTTGIREGGTLNSRYTNNTVLQSPACVTFDETGGVPTGYYPTDVRASSGLIFEGLKCLGTTGNSVGIDVTRFSTNLRFVDTILDGISGTGWSIEQRHRGLLIQGGSTKNVAGSAFQEITVAGTTAEESTTIRNHEIEGVDSDEIGGPNFLGIYTEATAGAAYCTDGASPCACSTDREGQWLVVTDASSNSDVTFLAGTGTVVNRAICTSAVWTEKATNTLTAGNSTAMAMLGANLVLDGIKLNHFPGSAISLATTALSPKTKLRNLTIVGDRWGFLGELTEAAANALNCGSEPAMEGKWAIITDASGATDCTVGSGTGATPNVCLCSSGVVDTWTDEGGGFQATARHGISLPAMTGDGITISNVECSELDSAGACINIPTATTATSGNINDITTTFRTSSITSLRTDYGIDITALGTGWTVNNVRCRNTDNVPCIDDGFVIADYVGSGAPTAELCDVAQEVGSTWRQTDAGDDAVLHCCEDAAGTPAWDNCTTPAD